MYLTKLKITHKGSQGKINKKHLLDLESLIFSLDMLPHIVCLTETWLCDDDEAISITGI